ncbi:OLC1v1012900C1 [Oldenlandia corymbosa var. corymbosa]|uniref:OLC1v1012900C1 n=1 Tax=Oldenlandia corymbosa var. corymbosa TaxID=529605 RepID=A0AAV1DWZ2_OLDCO|nr:OLC1v1012900C1 [Oldenlandia corymbosa var. corymbosa]
MKTDAKLTKVWMSWVPIDDGLSRSPVLAKSNIIYIPSAANRTKDPSTIEHPKQNHDVLIGVPLLEESNRLWLETQVLHIKNTTLFKRRESAKIRGQNGFQIHAVLRLRKEKIGNIHGHKGTFRKRKREAMGDLETPFCSKKLITSSHWSSFNRNIAEASFHFSIVWSQVLKGFSTKKPTRTTNRRGKVEASTATFEKGLVKNEHTKVAIPATTFDSSLITPEKGNISNI